MVGHRRRAAAGVGVLVAAQALRAGSALLQQPTARLRRRGFDGAPLTDRRTSASSSWRESSRRGDLLRSRASGRRGASTMALGRLAPVVSAFATRVATPWQQMPPGTLRHVEQRFLLGWMRRGCSSSFRSIAVFSGFFLLSAVLHSAEVAITTLYPFKIRQFVEQEGPSSSFALLNKDVTRVLTAILVATTCASICSTAIFAQLCVTFCGGSARRLAVATFGLTALTLLCGELLPKALGVNNAEVVARATIVPISFLTAVIGPVGTAFASLSRAVLRVMGFEPNDSNSVSEEEFRLIIGGATLSGGIESKEGTMIEGVLDLQQTRVAEVMRPRVEVRALERQSSMVQLLRLVEATGHTRIPVYDEEIDKIVGVVNAKKLLDYVKKGPGGAPLPLATAAVADHAEPAYFVPETMVAWKVLEEMRRRRLHMAVVVDEYGGTAGIVTLEDILEVVVGEIYDEDDLEDINGGEEITHDESADAFDILGTAALDDVIDRLDLKGVDPDELPDVTTAAGFLCFHAGEIPAVGDHVLVANYDFEVVKADDRRLRLIRARSLDAPGVLAKPPLKDDAKDARTRHLDARDDFRTTTTTTTTRLIDTIDQNNATRTAASLVLLGPPTEE